MCRVTNRSCGADTSVEVVHVRNRFPGASRIVVESCRIRALSKTIFKSSQRTLWSTANYITTGIKLRPTLRKPMTGVAWSSYHDERALEMSWPCMERRSLCLSYSIYITWHWDRRYMLTLYCLWIPYISMHLWKKLDSNYIESNMFFDDNFL